MSTVCCVMVTGKHDERRPLAYASLESFRQQTYEDKGLLIVNTGRPLLSPAVFDKGILEVIADPKLSLGELRNLALDSIGTKWVCQWDDDDWHHPKYLDHMMANGKEGHATLLVRQIRYSLATRSAFVLQRDTGIEGTGLFWKNSGRYRALGRAEDTHFLADNYAGKIIVMDNPAELYIRFAHGHNTWDSGHIMLGLDGVRDEVRLLPHQHAYLQEVLAAQYSGYSDGEVKPDGGG